VAGECNHVEESTHNADDAAHQCAICLSSMKTGDKVCHSTCDHIFHDACLHSWFFKLAKRERKKKNDTCSLDCPTCRQSFAGTLQLKDPDAEEELEMTAIPYEQRRPLPR